MDLLRARLRRADYRQVFGTKAGQRVLADIMDLCGVGGKILEPGMQDVTHARIGRLDVAFQINRRLGQTDEELFRKYSGRKSYGENDE